MTQNSEDDVPTQWLKLDVYFLAKPFPRQLIERFGPAGLVAWIGFLSACKRNHIQGRVTFAGDADARRQLFLDCAYTIELVDSQGEPWTTEHFFDFTGRMKQTRRIPHGRQSDSRKTPDGQLQHVVCTHWERWQNDVRTADARERKRWSRAKKARDQSVTEIEKEKEIENYPPTPQGGNVTSVTPKTQIKPEPPDYRTWVPEPIEQPPKDLRAALAQLRTKHFSGADPAGTAG